MKTLIALISLVAIAVITALVLSNTPEDKHLIDNFIPKPQPQLKQSSLLSLNLDKDIYKLDQQVYMQITSLDKSGNAFCSSNLELEITDAQSSKSNIPVKASTTCGDSRSNQPDYSAFFKPTVEGEYTITLTNLDNNEVAQAAFVVSNEAAEFSITRWGASKINVETRYPMKLTITSNSDFSGQLIEQIPDNIDIVWQGPAVVASDAITWKVDLKAGEKQEFNYEYIVSNDDSGIFNLGPARLCHPERSFSGVEGSGCVYEENNKWQIILDSRLRGNDN